MPADLVSREIDEAKSIGTRVSDFERFVEQELGYYEKGQYRYKNSYELLLIISVLSSALTPALVRLKDDPLPATISAVLTTASVAMMASFRLRDTYLRKANTYVQILLERTLFRARSGDYFQLRHSDEEALNEYYKKITAIIEAGVRDWHRTTLEQPQDQVQGERGAAEGKHP
jgi:hypothetical protein